MESLLSPRTVVWKVIIQIDSSLYIPKVIPKKILTNIMYRKHIRNRIHQILDLSVFHLGTEQIM